eukprot:g7346.t1
MDPCPDPAVLPAGYVKTTGENISWICADGYVGTASISCVASPIEAGAGVQCNVTSTLTGCLGKLPCLPLPLDACMLDASNCSDGVPAGGSCEVLCKYPYTGIPGEAQCPEINTGTNTLPSLKSPMCMVDCSQLEMTIPTGYRHRANDTGWECDTGYSGFVTEDCFLRFDSSPCGTPELLLRGCQPLVDCVAPMVDLCQYDVSDCQAVSRGNSCTISCRLPYSGTSLTATCPQNNTDALQGLQVTLPPPGDGRTAVRTCSAFSDQALGNAAQGPQCYTEAVFSGCKVVAEIVPCQPPVVDKCLHNASSCMGPALQPGGACEIGCLSPFYRGQATVATSHSALMAGFEWMAPQCSVWCPEPTLEEEPAYGRNPEGGSSQDSSGWICNPGYAGIAQVYCQLLPPVHGARCGVARLQMSGCSRLEPCVPLVRLPAPPPARGTHVLRDGEGFELEVHCGLLGPGEACLLGCRAPFVGELVTASCPVGNTNRFQAGAPVLNRAPFCELRCPDPEEAPWGYRTRGPNQWECTPDYTGEPLKYCNASAACNASALADSVAIAETSSPEGDCENAVELEISFTGCTKRQPCLGPDLSLGLRATNLGGWPGSGADSEFFEKLASSCQVESFNCQALLAPGSECEVRCRFPFQGSPSIARCPADNILLEGAGLVFTMPDCQLPECYDPVPSGYQYSLDGWTCAEGFHGLAQRSCSTDSNCEAEIALTGCEQLQPCRSPPMDRCRYDFSDCRSTVDGMTCEVRCQSPFYASLKVGSARCAAGNIDPEELLEVIELPWCEPVCDQAAPPGYVPLPPPAKGWQCANGYRGTPNAVCQIFEAGSSCEVACKHPHNCPELMPAGSSCEITCKRPLVGTSSLARCPDNNTIQRKQADWAAPDCRCPDPEFVPFGYAPGIDEWHCLSGYVGKARKVCPCNGEVSVLEGCHAPLICGAAGFTDSDTRKGFVGGELRFGPSAIDERMDEDGVSLGVHDQQEFPVRKGCG